MKRGNTLVAVGLIITLSGCGAELEPAAPSSGEQEVLPVDKAPDARPQPSAEDGSVSAMSFGPQLEAEGTFWYTTGLSGKSYNVLQGGACKPGFVRSGATAQTIDGSGSCSFGAWASDVTSDCQMYAHVVVGSFGHGHCTWKTYSMEMHYLDYTASNTNSAQQNTMDVQIDLTAGQTINVGTCGLPGVSASGDTYLRLLGATGSLVASNDDACSGVSSNLIYEVPATGTYTLKMGCYSSTSCGGRVGYSIQ